MTELSTHGVTVELPPGFEGRGIRRDTGSAGAGVSARAVVALRSNGADHRHGQCDRPCVDGAPAAGGRRLRQQRRRAPGARRRVRCRVRVRLGSRGHAAVRPAGNPAFARARRVQPVDPAADSRAASRAHRASSPRPAVPSACTQSSVPTPDGQRSSTRSTRCWRRSASSRSAVPAEPARQRSRTHDHHDRAARYGRRRGCRASRSPDAVGTARHHRAARRDPRVPGRSPCSPRDDPGVRGHRSRRAACRSGAAAPHARVPRGDRRRARRHVASRADTPDARRDRA